MAISKPDLRPFLLPVAAIASAEIYAYATQMQSYSLAPPSGILSAGLAAIVDGTLPIATWETLLSTVAGFMLGAVMGVSFGIILGLQNALDKVSELSVETARAIPPIAVLPIWMIIYGLGFQMEIAIIAFSTMWPNLVMTRAAVRNVEPRLMEVSKVLGLGAFARVFKIVLPAALPRIFVALRLCLGFSLIIAVTVEIIANPQGLGSAIMQAREAANPGLMLAALAWIGVLGFLLNALMQLIERRTFGHLGGTE